MTTHLARIALGLALIVVGSSRFTGQGVSDMEALLRNLPTQVPELPQAQVQVHGNTSIATYNIVSASPKMVSVLMPVEIQVASYASHEEADQGVRVKIHIASITPTETQTSGGVVVYRWKTQGLSRTLSRCGSYVVDISGRPSSDLAVNKAFDALTKQVGGR